MTRRFWLSALIFLLSAGGIALWSYAYLDPNLVLINHPVYLQFQNTLWGWRSSSWTSVWWYLIAVTLLFGSYAGLLKNLFQVPLRQLIFVWGALSGVFLLGHNALSHDIFNYLFNAKMVLVYQANPHVMTALDFASDPWIRFMHNVHTPAPYAYGWTALSLVPYALGMGKFLLSFLATRLFMWVGLALTGLGLWRFLRDRENGTFWLAAFLFHPLVLIETVLNGHNDVWMMWPALWAFAIAQDWRRFSWRSIGLWSRITAVLLLMLLSGSIKYVTFLLIPLFVIFLPNMHVRFERFLALVRPWWADIATLLLLLPLVTARSQQFHPWYLIWALSFWPLCRSGFLRGIVFGLSVSSLYRYLPWLEGNLEYTPVVQTAQRAITAAGLAAGAIVVFTRRMLTRASK